MEIVKKSGENEKRTQHIGAECCSELEIVFSRKFNYVEVEMEEE